uniref:Uncharacterized protein n=1 Tax=Ditylum brightwellii TaxID=49249 RepID=A0A6S9A3K9_9STRA|mmetsp:Transcript_28142/g.37443  ORF Transcript_28142/g.37443 Transcript_28142/m.37443 type:complete len:304 (+) Transcript_28142:343-1254(+)
MSQPTSTSAVAAAALNDIRFRGKIVVITGAGGTFGREGCLYFARRGASIAALDNNPSALNETVAYIDGILESSDISETVRTFACDVTDAESVETAVAEIMKSFGRIDMLWNNAGYQGQIKPTLEYDPKDFAMVMNINVTGMFIVLQSVAKRMAATAEKGKDDDEGSSSHSFSIVNTASVAGLRGTPAMIAYSSSKAAVLAMTVSSSKDLAPYGIRVNAVSPALIGPGFMWTRQNELHAASGSPYFDSDSDKVASAKVNSVPMKRLGSVHEVLKSVAYLLSEDSSYSTGTNLVVDGGLSSGLKA